MYTEPGWTLVDHLAGLDPDLLALARTEDGTGWALTPHAAEARRLLTLDDPLLFAWIYTPHHLRGEETGDRISFSAFHLRCFEDARGWLRPLPGPAEDRRAYVAPRNAGKSTIWFQLVPWWAAAHMVAPFIAAFADSGGQAELHLQSFKRELDRNELLRHDYPDLVKPARRPGGSQVQDNRGMYLAKSGFVFVARGIDASSLGMKVDERRPSVLLLDDVEPPEATYSLGQKGKRLSTIREAVFPLNLNARVVMVGTTTMHGSVMHDVARQATDPSSCPDWVAEENIRVRYFPAIVTADDGTEHSLWPERWSIEFLQSIRGTRSYAKNYDNRPISTDGGYWTPDHFRYDVPEAMTRRLLSIDPAGTSKAGSDFTGLSVIGYSPAERRCAVLYAAQVKLTPAQLRERCLDLLSRYDVRAALLETNSGGDAWPEVLALPVKVVTLHQHEAKHVRAARVLDYYESGWVAHDGRMPALEEEMLAFPSGANDDMVDSVGSGLHFFLRDRRSGPPTRPRARAVSYA